MRLRIDITTRTPSIPWDTVLRPGRGLLYHLLAEAAPELGTQLHNTGWGPHRMVPVGHSAPTFPHARRRRGLYTTNGPGYLEIASPLAGLIDALTDTLATRDILDWGGTALHIHNLTPLAPPAFTTGHAEFRTTTPVVLKALTTPDSVIGPTKGKDILPYENGFTDALHHNLRRKAETLNLDPEITLHQLTWIGAKRGFATTTGRRTGAPLAVALQGAPRTLRALWSWGLGQTNHAGFGWIAAQPQHNTRQTGFQQTAAPR